MTWILERTGLGGGVYRGRLRKAEGAAAPDGPPALEAAVDGAALAAATVEPGDDGSWRVEANVGAALAEGVHAVVLRPEGGEALDVVTVVAGLDPEHDLRAELAVLRVELAQLKAAFRRHVREGEGEGG